MPRAPPVSYRARMESSRSVSVARWIRGHPDVLLAVAAAVLNVVVGTFALGISIRTGAWTSAATCCCSSGRCCYWSGPGGRWVYWPGCSRNVQLPVAGLSAGTDLVAADRGVRRRRPDGQAPRGVHDARGRVRVGDLVSSALRDDEKTPSLVAMVGIAAWLLMLAAVSELIRYRSELRRAARREELERSAPRPNRLAAGPARSVWTSPASCTTSSRTASR